MREKRAGEGLCTWDAYVEMRAAFDREQGMAFGFWSEAESPEPVTETPPEVFWISEGDLFGMKWLGLESNQ